MKERNKIKVAWGLEFGGSALRLVRLERRGASLVAEACKDVPLDGRQDSRSLAEAAGKLALRAAGEPVACCIGDELVLVRCAALPRANAANLERMVAGQIEAMLMARADLFATGWSVQGQVFKDGLEHVVIAAARKDSLAGFQGALQVAQIAPSAIVPSSQAIAAVFGGLMAGAPGGATSNETALCVDISARSTSLMLLWRGQYLAGGTLDQGSDHWVADGLDGWSRQLRELYQSCMAPLSGQGGLAHAGQTPPRKCLLFGKAARTPDVATAVGSALGLAAEAARAPEKLSLPPGVDFAQLAPAIGCALSQLDRADSADGRLRRDGHTGACSLVAPGEVPQSASARRGWWKWAAAAWLVAGVLAMYGLDMQEHARLGDAQRTLRAMAEMNDDRTLLALGHYLGQAGPGAMGVLDAVSTAAPPQAVLTSWNYVRGGEISLGGTVSSEQELYDFLKSLSDSPLLAGGGSATLQSAKNDQGRLRFQLALKLADASKARSPASSQAASQAASSPASKPVAASMPGSASSSRPSSAKGPSLSVMPAEAVPPSPSMPATPQPPMPPGPPSPAVRAMPEMQNSMVPASAPDTGDAR